MIILDVPLYNQRELGYPTGCETVSLAMMIGFSKSVDIDELFLKLPYDFDPNKGFRGNPRDDSGFTVFPQALLSLVSEYFENPSDMSGCGLSELKGKLEQGSPVLVWVSGLGFGVHAVCLSGFNETGFFYNDPWTGEKDAFISFADFCLIWDKPVFDEELKIPYPARKALSYIPPDTSA